MTSPGPARKPTGGRGTGACSSVSAASTAASCPIWTADTVGDNWLGSSDSIYEPANNERLTNRCERACSGSFMRNALNPGYSDEEDISRLMATLGQYAGWYASRMAPKRRDEFGRPASRFGDTVRIIRNYLAIEREIKPFTLAIGLFTLLHTREETIDNCEEQPF